MVRLKYEYSLFLPPSPPSTLPLLPPLSLSFLLPPSQLPPSLIPSLSFLLPPSQLPLFIPHSLPASLSFLEVRIGFEVSTVSISESTTVDVVLSLQGGMLGRTATVEVTSVDGLATG